MGFRFFSGLMNKKGRQDQEEMMEMGGLGSQQKNEVLLKENIKLKQKTVGKYEAIRMAGRLLVDSGCVDESYIEAMLQREEDLSTYIGSGVAIPHGVGKAKEFIKKSGIVVLQYPEGVDFGEEKAYLVIGIAGVGNEHLDILSNIATVIGEDEEKLMRLITTDDVNFIYDAFTTA